MRIAQTIVPCLWFDDQAEEAANFYTSVFPNSKVVTVTRYGEAGREVHKRPVGSAMTVEFELDGQRFTALNGGPLFKFSEAISFQVMCDTQDEVDYFWGKLTEGGDPQAQQCGWLRDKFDVSWQVVPRALAEMLQEQGSQGATRAMTALLRMKKLDMNELKRAFTG